jgi:hypothetical protein
MFEKQQQEAGDNSQQIQASTVIINNGISEERARAIYDEKHQEVINDYTQEAHSVASHRIQVFADDLIPKLVKESLLDALKDPSIQVLLIEAQKAAASTERPVDYSLLSELLINRVKQGSDRNIRAGISRAVRIVDEISDEALLALTVVYSATYFFPAIGNITDGIKKCNIMFDKIIYANLPTGNAWLDHLDILDAVRINQIGNIKRFNQYYPERMSWYIDVGIEKDSENYEKAIELVEQANLPKDILCDHELRDGYVRLQLINKEHLDMLTINLNQAFDFNGNLVFLPIQIQLTDTQKQAVNDIYSLYVNDTALRNENNSEFFKLWDKYNSLRILREWWDDIPMPFSITAIGRVLANANARRCDPTLPPLDLSI